MTLINFHCVGCCCGRSGLETLEAADAASALQLAAACKPECAVVDLRLPTEKLGLRVDTRSEGA